MEKGKISKKMEKRFEILKQAYDEEGSMTLRRCFYILVGKNEIKNSTSAYQNLSLKLVEAREKGWVGWNMMVDRHRQILKRNTSISFEDAFENLCYYYRKDSMQDQDFYVEVWIEKDAVASVIYNFTSELDIPLLVGKGFPSITHLKKASDRFKEQNKPCKILYISDFDPEGEFFPKKVLEKLNQYGCENTVVEKIALTKEQKEKYNLLNNKDFKIKDKHKEKKYVQDFIKKYGEIQIELDALSNKILLTILKKKLESLNFNFDIPEQSDKDSLEDVENWKLENLV